LLVTDATSGVIGTESQISDIQFCETCDLIAAIGGEITNVDLDGARIVAIELAGGVLRRFSRFLEERPANTPTLYQPPYGAIGPGFPGTPNGRSQPDQRPVSIATQEFSRVDRRAPIRALIADGLNLRATVRSKFPVSLSSRFVPRIEIAAAGGTISAEPVVAGRERFAVHGRGFVPPDDGGSGVTVFLDGSAVTRDAAVRQDGSFALEFVAPSAPGNYVVLAEQHAGSRTDRTWVVLRVLPHDYGVQLQSGRDGR
jgi:hypothetical protein